MLLRLVQDWNALYPIEVTLTGIVMLLRLVHDWNAPAAIEVTLSGIVMLVRPDSRNARYPIEVTGRPL